MEGISIWQLLIPGHHHHWCCCLFNLKKEVGAHDMKRFLSVIAFVLLAFTHPVFALDKPSVKDVEHAVSSMLRKEMPRSLTKGMELALGLERVDGGIVELIEIRQFGNVNEEKNYWPVRLKVSGKVIIIEMMFMKRKRSYRNFSGMLDIRMRQNDFGEWTASYPTDYSYPTH